MRLASWSSASSVMNLYVVFGSNLKLKIFQKWNSFDWLISNENCTMHTHLEFAHWNDVHFEAVTTIDRVLHFVSLVEQADWTCAKCMKLKIYYYDQSGIWFDSGYLWSPWKWIKYKVMICANLLDLIGWPVCAQFAVTAWISVSMNWPNIALNWGEILQRMGKNQIYLIWALKHSKIIIHF